MKINAWMFMYCSSSHFPKYRSLTNEKSAYPFRKARVYTDSLFKAK